MKTRSSSIGKVGSRGRNLVALNHMGGFTFIGLMAIVSIMGVILLTVGEVWHIAQRREKEVELLFIGNQFRNAISSYYANTPGATPAANPLLRYPASLEDLLKDPRYPTTQRYLRKVYIDPITGSTTWGLVKNPGGGIYGVYSESSDTPIKSGNFSLADKGLEGKTKYSEWVFMYVQTTNSGVPAVRR